MTSTLNWKCQMYSFTHCKVPECCTAAEQVAHHTRPAGWSAGGWGESHIHLAPVWLCHSDKPVRPEWEPPPAHSRTKRGTQIRGDAVDSISDNGQKKRTWPPNDYCRMAVICVVHDWSTWRCIATSHVTIWHWLISGDFFAAENRTITFF